MYALLVGGVALVAAFVLAPAAILRGSHPRYADHTLLIADVNSGVDAYWRSGARELTADLAALADYWFQWHAIKIVISALLVVVLGALAVTLWRRSMTASPVGYTVAASSVTALALFSIFALIANVQSTVAPLVALLPMVSSDQPDPALAQTLTEIGRAVASPSSAQPHPLLTLTEHVARYNWVMIALAAPLTLAFGAAGVIAVRRSRASTNQRRRMFVILAVFAVVMTAVLLFLSIAAVIAVSDPATALLDILGI